MTDRKSGWYDVVDIKSTANEFVITLGQFHEDEDDTAKLTRLLREHNAFSQSLLEALLELVEGERRAGYEEAMDSRDDRW